MVPNSSFPDLFQGKTAVLATMHQKEQAIAPLLAEHLNLHITVPENFNTDEFGTFTRDIKRPGDQLNAARLKAEKALALTGLTVAVASEGSFGPHPSLPFLTCDYEMVLFWDRTHNLEVVGQALSAKTNYNHQQVRSLEAALAFAEKVGFPSHGLVVMLDAQPTPEFPIFKGITQEETLIKSVTWFLENVGHAHLETDMRAMHNPTRMAVIAQATQDLIHKLKQCCPQCNLPGFAPVDHQPGLPCALCGLPTGLTLRVLYHCQQCGFSHHLDFPDGQRQADPAHCPYCNP